MPFEMHEEAVTSGSNIKYNGFAHSFAGMGLQFMLFAAINIAGGFLVTRRMLAMFRK